MPDGDRAAIDVHDRRIPAHVLVDGERLSGEGLVGLDEIEIVDLPAGLFERLAGSRDRAGSHDGRIDAGGGPGDDAGERCQAALRRFRLAVISTTAAAPSLMPDALPAVTVPSLEKAGFNLPSASIVVPWRGCIRRADTMMSPLRVEIVKGMISSLNLPAFWRPRPCSASGRRSWSCSSRRELPLLGDVLGGRAHVIALEGVHQAVLEHGVAHLQVAHLGAAAHIGGMRRLDMQFLAARHDDPGVSVGDLLHAERDGAKP